MFVPTALELLPRLRISSAWTTSAASEPQPLSLSTYWDRYIRKKCAADFAVGQNVLVLKLTWTVLNRFV